MNHYTWEKAPIDAVSNRRDFPFIFDVPASALRYWEDMGVLNPLKDSENHYRDYTMEGLMTISGFSNSMKNTEQSIHRFFDEGRNSGWLSK